MILDNFYLILKILKIKILKIFSKIDFMKLFRSNIQFILLYNK